MTDAAVPRTLKLATRNQEHSLFAQTMGYVAATVGLFVLGAYAGRDWSGGLGIIGYVLAFVALIGMYVATGRGHRELSVGLLGAFGFLLGVALSTTLAHYAHHDPSALWQAGGSTALFIAVFGSAGYATRRDLGALARVLSWALVGLLVFGIVLLFVEIPGASLVYSVLGLVIFAGYTLYDFQRLRRSQDITSAPLVAASIFLDVLNVFTFFLRLFSSDG